MRTFAISFAALAGLAFTAGASHAQSVAVEIDTDGPAYGYSTYRGYGPSYGYYGYRADAPVRRTYEGPRYGYRSDVIVEERGNGGGCGTYFYWNGDRCVDARNK